MIPEGYVVWETLAEEDNGIEYNDDPFESNCDLYFHPDTGKSGFYCQRKHCNGSGFVHGGMLATLADSNLFSAGSPHTKGGVTVQLSLQYVASAKIGDWVEAEGSVVRNTNRLVFIRGRIFVGEKTIATYDGIVKKTSNKL